MSVLILGFGNPLAGDDALGWRAAEMLASSLERPGVRVMPCRQLTPELAADVAEASLAIFLDASVELPAGKIGCRRVTPQPAATPFTHHFSPAALLSLAEQIYGRRPEAVLFSVGARSFAGSQLSREVEQALPALLEEVEELVARVMQAGQPACEPARSAPGEDLFSVMH
jgi:hydrogenase maturation protease